MRTRDAVRIDIRAAQIAIEVAEGKHSWEGKELNGWMRAGDNRERGSLPHSPEWQAGWFAAQIWFDTHQGKKQ